MDAVAWRPLRLRPGVEILRTGPRRFLLLSRPTGEQFEFGAEERLLLHLIEHAPSEEAIHKEFEDRFRRPLSRRHLEEFIEQLRHLRLLDECESRQSSAAGRADIPVCPEPPKADRNVCPTKQPVPSAPPPTPIADPKAGLNLFFDFLVLLFGWVLHPVWIVPILLLTLLAAWVVIAHWDQAMTTVHLPTRTIPPLALALLSIVQTLLFVNLPRNLLFGMTTRRFGGRVQSFGLSLWLDLLPCFRCEVGDSFAFLKGRGRWTILQGDIYAYLSIGSASVILWACSRYTTAAGAFWLFLVPPCLFGVLMHLVVFGKFCGYWLLSYALGDARLQERALAETDAWLTGHRSPEALTSDERYWFRLYGVAYYAFWGLFQALLAVGGTWFLINKFHGPGALTALLLIIWLYRHTIQQLLCDHAAIAWFLQVLATVVTLLCSLPYGGVVMRWLIRFGGFFWVRWPFRLAVLLGTLYGIGSIPYSYDVAGECRLVPVAQYGVRVGLSEEVVKVLVAEGDYVRPGDSLATLRDSNLRSEISMTEAELKKAEAKLDLLLTGHQAEDIRIAENRAETARVNYKSADEQYNRADYLYRRDRAAALQEVEQKQKSRDTAYEQLKTAEDNLAKLKAGYREENLRSEEAEVKRLEEKLKQQRGQLKYLQVTTPIGGRVVTPYMEQRLGQTVKAGDLIAVVQDTSKLLVELAADDAAATDVRPGMRVNVRLYSTWGRVLTGKVVRVAVASEPDVRYGNSPVRSDKETLSEESVNYRAKSSGYHTRVYVELDELPPGLTPEMTGYARVVVDEDEVLWRAFARPVVRFLRTEVWYWLP